MNIATTTTTTAAAIATATTNDDNIINRMKWRSKMMWIKKDLHLDKNIKSELNKFILYGNNNKSNNILNPVNGNIYIAYLNLSNRFVFFISFSLSFIWI